VILPACDEAPCLAAVLAELRAVLPPERFTIAVGVNGSSDATAEIARECGALVAETDARGYGYGCQAAIDAVERECSPVDAYIFVAADGANDPRDILALVAAHDGGTRMVLGSRTTLRANRSPLRHHYIVANRILGAWCGLLTGRWFSDLGPLRLIERELFHAMRLREWTFGWTIEAQIRAARLGASIREVPVRERGRIAGEQKVSHVSWHRTLAIGLHIAAAGLRSRIRDYSATGAESRRAIPEAASAAS
jgi:glycosyltransferase involved in cell wall biosynthesis